MGRTYVQTAVVPPAGNPADEVGVSFKGAGKILQNTTSALTVASFLPVTQRLYYVKSLLNLVNIGTYEHFSIKENRWFAWDGSQWLFPFSVVTDWKAQSPAYIGAHTLDINYPGGLAAVSFALNGKNASTDIMADWEIEFSGGIDIAAQAVLPLS